MGNYKGDFFYWVMLLSIIVLALSGIFGIALFGNKEKTMLFMGIYLVVILLGIGIVNLFSEKSFVQRPKRSRKKH